jgi:hypothetical protein
MYWKEGNFGITPHFKRNPENSSHISDTLWTSAAQMVYVVDG